MEYVTIKGKEHPIQFSYRAIKEFENQTGKSFGDFGENILDFEIIIFQALIAGAIEEGRQLQVSRDDVESWLDSDISNLKIVRSLLNNLNGLYDNGHGHDFKKDIELRG